MRRHVRIHLLTYLGSICVCMWQLNNRLFEELAMDVYDEVDRRENDAGEPHFSSSPVCFLGGFSPIWKLAVIIEIENTSTRHHWHEKKRWRRKREKNCRESRCWEDREGIWKTECYRGRPNGVSEWVREEERRSTEVPPKFLRSLSPPPWLFLARSVSLSFSVSSPHFLQ